MRRQDGFGSNSQFMLLVLVLCPAALGINLKENWYVMRGRSNMKIHNYKAAIEAFEHAVSINPKNREAMRMLGQAYESQGLTDPAIDTYEKYLSRFGPEADVAYKLGDYFQGKRYAHRRGEAVKYYRMGLRQKEDLAYRHKLARLLGAQKATLEEAVEEYRILLKAAPDNGQYRKEYRALLLWDPHYLGDAIREYEALARQQPGNFAINHEYAQLLARDKARVDDAVRQYRTLVAAQPGNLSLRREYAAVLAQSPAHLDDARKEYEYVLARSGTYETRVAYADLLAQRSSTRGDALKEYRALVDRNPSDAKVRLKYAGLLGSQRSPADEALSHYLIVIKQQPTNADAHLGAARMYAWMGDRDKALHHSQLAKKYAPSGTAISQVHAQLSEGREPYLGGGIDFLMKPGEFDGLGGFVVSIEGRGEPITSLTLGGKLGYEQYRNYAPDILVDYVRGVLFRMTAQYRPDPHHEIDALLGVHLPQDFRDGLELGASYTRTGAAGRAGIGFTRDLIYETWLSIAGDSVSSGPGMPLEAQGGARRNRFWSSARAVKGGIAAGAYGFLGWVTAMNAPPNGNQGAVFDIGYTFPQRPLQMALAYRLSIERYNEDRSGLSPNVSDTAPLPGGYFSPQTCFDNRAAITATYESAGEFTARVAAEPGIQYVADRSREGSVFAVRIAGEFTRILPHDIFIKGSGSFEQVAAYSRFQLGAFFGRRF